MISQRARAGFDNLLPKCLEASLRSEAHPVWRMKSPLKAADIVAPHGIMLTISSYEFRMMVLLHFSSNKAAMRYVADTLRIGSGDLAISRFNDYLSEISNGFCGEVKREMGHFFPHLGMSTPNRLDKESLKHVKAWPIDHEAHARAQSEDGAEFYGSLYISAESELDFDVKNATAEEQVDSGALEMF